MSHGSDGLPDITKAIHLLCDNDDVEVYFKLYLYYKPMMNYCKLP